MVLISTDEVATVDLAEDDTNIFVTLESEVRSYCRSFPTTFTKAKGAHLVAEDGTTYIDFFCGASSLNYGHNNDRIKEDLVAYLQADGVMHALDMHTTAKREFLVRFRDVILRPRGLPYKVQFCGPTGTDAVEAALKLARRVTGRTGIIAFSGAYHGMSAGSLSATGSARARNACGIPLSGTHFLPFESGPWGSFDSMDLLSKMLSDRSSGIGLPAAVIVEPVQMEGGIYPASNEWLRKLREITSAYGILLILDEIQSGCGRTGTYFCFEQAGITPDLVTVSKSISGYGLPMSLVLLRPELDAWQPGEHTGTFRGTQLSFVAASAALEFWQDPVFMAQLEASARRLELFGQTLKDVDPRLDIRGRGMVLGIDLADSGGHPRAAEVQRSCFESGLIVELCGRDDEVIKVMPPLTVDGAVLEAGLDILRDAMFGSAAGTRGR
jgi:diaminobutyrate-2-oxoglutarate transaminase